MRIVRLPLICALLAASGCVPEIHRFSPGNAPEKVDVWWGEKRKSYVSRYVDGMVFVDPIYAEVLLTPGKETSLSHARDVYFGRTRHAPAPGRSAGEVSDQLFGGRLVYVVSVEPLVLATDLQSPASTRPAWERRGTMRWVNAGVAGVEVDRLAILQQNDVLHHAVLKLPRRMTLAEVMNGRPWAPADGQP